MIRAGLLALLLISFVPPASALDGVCAGMCTCEAWGTCGMGSGGGGGGGGGGWLRGPTPEEQAAAAARRRQYREYLKLRKERKAAAVEFAAEIKEQRAAADRHFDWAAKNVSEVRMPVGRPFGTAVGRSLSMKGNPTWAEAKLAGVELARPLGETQMSETSFDGLLRFKAILDMHAYRKDSQLPYAGQAEDLYFMSSEGAAHMSGHASRVTVSLKRSGVDEDEARRTVERFRADWGQIVSEQNIIHKSEDERLELAREEAEVDAQMYKIDKKMAEADGRKKEKLAAKRAKLAAEKRALAEKAAAKKKAERAATAKVQEKGRKIFVLEE